jgi:hypothetical protein
MRFLRACFFCDAARQQSSRNDKASIRKQNGHVPHLDAGYFPTRDIVRRQNKDFFGWLTNTDAAFRVPGRRVLVA